MKNKKSQLSYIKYRSYDQYSFMEKKQLAPIDIYIYIYGDISLYHESGQTYIQNLNRRISRFFIFDSVTFYPMLFYFKTYSLRPII